MKFIDMHEFPMLFRRFSTATPKDAPQMVEDLAAEGHIALEPTNIDKLSTTAFVESRFTFGPATQVAINGIEGVFRNDGVSIAICGENHTYQNPSTNVQMIKTFSKTGMSFEEATEMLQEGKALKVKAQIESEAETFLASKQDQTRAKQLLLLASGGMKVNPDLIILERGLKYDSSHNPKGQVIKEEDILPGGLELYTIKRRSMALAAYIFLIVAGGDQSRADRILVFIGENHKDIAEYFDRYALTSQKIPWVRRRRRNYLVIPSHVH